jgi:hypothetical protein
MISSHLPRGRSRRSRGSRRQKTFYEIWVIICINLYFTIREEINGWGIISRVNCYTLSVRYQYKNHHYRYFPIDLRGEIYWNWRNSTHRPLKKGKWRRSRKRNKIWKIKPFLVRNNVRRWDNRCNRRLVGRWNSLWNG